MTYGDLAQTRSVKSRDTFSLIIRRTRFENRFCFSWMLVKRPLLVGTGMLQRHRRRLATFYDFPHRLASSRIRETRVRLYRVQFCINTYQSFAWRDLQLMRTSELVKRHRNLRSTWSFVSDVIHFLKRIFNSPTIICWACYFIVLM